MNHQEVLDSILSAITPHDEEVSEDIFSASERESGILFFQLDTNYSQDTVRIKARHLGDGKFEIVEFTTHR